MNPYVIFADSSADLTEEMKAAWDIRTADLTFLFDDAEKDTANTDFDIKEFYRKIREGHTARTAAVNNQIFEDAFEQELKEGRDVLYIGFSSGLSTTFQCASIAAGELKERYPGRKILLVDSLAASAGYAMLLYLTAEEKKKGADIEKAAQYAEDMKLHICHWFTVDDLSYLTKGGRVASAVAAVGGMLKIKPVLHMDNAGHLIPVSIARGRKQSLKAIVDQYEKLAVEPAAGPVFISHGDCEEEAEYLAGLIRERCGAAATHIVFVGPVIGAHTGPGVISLFFVGKER